MGWFRRAYDRRLLETEIRSLEYRWILERLAGSSIGTGAVSDWADVWGALDASPADGPHFEKAVAALALDPGVVAAPSGRTVLLRMYWPKLVAAAKCRRTWDEDQDELWQTLVISFLDSLLKLRRPTASRSLGRKLLNDATRRLYRTYRRRWRTQKHEISTDPVLVLDAPACATDPEFTRIDLERAQSRVLQQFSGHRKAGRINETDELILAASQVYGVPLRRIAHASGLPYERIKKRRQRLERKISRADHFLVPVRQVRGPLHG